MSNVLKLITAPTELAVSLADMKEHLRVDISDDDDLITAYIKAAVKLAEKELDRQLLTATYDQYFDRFPAYLRLQRPPLQSVTSVKYIDTAGTLQTLDSSRYIISNSKEPAEIWPAYGYVWPPTRTQIEAVVVRFVCGWAAADIPPDILHALKLIVGGWYENREEITEKQLYRIPNAAKMLLGMNWTGEL